MAATNSGDRIEDNEYLYRRIPVSQGWYRPELSHLPDGDAFRPQRYDDTGISLERARSDHDPSFFTVEQTAQGRSKGGYYVAVLRMGDLREQGIEVVARTTPESAGHVELPQLNYLLRNTDEVKELSRVLADKLTLRVEGPFFPSDE